MYICICVCIYMHTNICACTHKYTYLYVRSHISMYACMFMYIYIHRYFSLYIYKFVCIWKQVRANRATEYVSNICTHMFVDMYIYLCLCLCMSMSMYIQDTHTHVHIHASHIDWILYSHLYMYIYTHELIRQNMMTAAPQTIGSVQYVPRGLQHVRFQWFVYGCMRYTFCPHTVNIPYPFITYLIQRYVVITSRF